MRLCSDSATVLQVDDERDFIGQCALKLSDLIEAEEAAERIYLVRHLDE